jgi:chaperonin GroES|tara:strand:- start:373 stop:663 length:291 start_codon:yes stop_codon:yes gene_type:complete
MALKVKPLSDRVVVEPAPAEDVSTGGIILPDTAQEKPQQGTVVAAGPGKVSDSGKNVAMEVKKGDRILYGKYSGTEFSFEGTEYLIMRESDILAVL